MSGREMSDSGILNIEFSGGVFDHEQIQDIEETYDGETVQYHNYFPPPEIPFVMNLASLNEKIFKETENHIKRLIECSARMHIPRYSFHAGFLIDPLPNELGRKVSPRPLYSKVECHRLFIQRVAALANYASEFGVELLIENNVLSAGNYERFGDNPFLLVDPDEIINAFDMLPKNVKLLLDVAHLKVSGTTQKFDYSRAMTKLRPYVGGYHLSDNDGLSDSNQPFDENSWFLPYISDDVEFSVIEVYDPNISTLVNQVSLVQSIVS